MANLREVPQLKIHNNKKKFVFKIHFEKEPILITVFSTEKENWYILMSLVHESITAFYYFK